MISKEFEKFIKSDFTLEIRQGDKIIFRSKKEGVDGLLVFVKKYGQQYQGLIIFDRIIGRAAALLFAYLGAKEVFGVIGSKVAMKVLRKFRIKFYFKKTVENILNKYKTGSCPMEVLSKAKTPEKLYNLLSHRRD